MPDMQSAATVADTEPRTPPSVSGRIHDGDVFPVESIVLLMFAGTLKAAPQLDGFRFESIDLEIDLTALAVGLVSMAIMGRCLTTRGALPLPYGAIALAAAFVPGFVVGAANPYTSKAQLGVVISGIAAVGAFWLLRTPARRKLWLWLLVVSGVVVALLLEPDVSGVETVAGRGSTISASQALGVAVVVILTLVMHGTLATKPRLVAALALTTFLVMGLIATGSRGPVAGAGVALVLSAIMLRRPGRLKRSLVVGGLLTIGWFVLVALTNPGAERLRMALSGQIDNTESRDVVWRRALEAIPLHPEGVGWGNFWSVLDVGEALDSGYEQHAHNIILEAFVEGGWIAGVAMIVLIATALLRLRSTAQRGPYEAAVFSVAVFFVVCAMFSGSMGNDRATFAALAVGFAVQRNGGDKRDDVGHSGDRDATSGTAGRAYRAD